MLPDTGSSVDIPTLDVPRGHREDSDSDQAVRYWLDDEQQHAESEVFSGDSNAVCLFN